ncbi:hypothetical protein ILYODFUR_026357 [Ilyodon furcidens]|uniref:Uncharacterized protein n=1 Tax=Ilyodon furcidens TaxID=33524 RepID=A0ABV0U8K5_9TELE
MRRGEDTQQRSQGRELNCGRLRLGLITSVYGGNALPLYHPPHLMCFFNLCLKCFDGSQDPPLLAAVPQQSAPKISFNAFIIQLTVGGAKINWVSHPALWPVAK